MNPSTPPPDPMTRTQCFLCGSDMYIADAQNHSGHYAHGSCIARQAAGGNPSLPEDYRPVPRRDFDRVPGKGESKIDEFPTPRCRALYTTDNVELRCHQPEGHTGRHTAHDPEGVGVDWHNNDDPPSTLPQGSRITEPDPEPPGMYDLEDPLLPSLVIGQDVNPATEFDAETKAMVAFIFPKELVEDGPNAVDILREIQLIAELLLTKNRAYGSSFAVPLNVFSKLSPVEAIRARMDDKLARIKQSKDFTEDTNADLIGYLILERIALKLAAQKKKGLIKDMQWHCLYQSPVGLQCQLPAGHEGLHQILTDTEQTKLDAKLGTQPQRVAFVDPAFSSADKAVMGMAEITPQGLVSVQHPGPAALQQKFARVLDKLEETASKANMPKADFTAVPDSCDAVDEHGLRCRRYKGHKEDHEFPHLRCTTERKKKFPGQPDVREVCCLPSGHTERHQFVTVVPEGHQDEPTNSPFIPTSEDYQQMFLPLKGHQDEPGPARPADQPFYKGNLVRTGSGPAGQQDWYNESIAKLRRWNTEGVITQESNSHRLCYAVKYADGVEDWFNPEELAPAAPAAGSSPPGSSSTVEGHAPAPPVSPAPPAAVSDGL